MTLDDRELVFLAERLAEVLAPRLARRALVDAETLAGLLNVEREWVYEHAAELGARRLGDGPRPRLRFDVDEAIDRLTCLEVRKSAKPQTRTVEPVRRRRRSSPMGTGVPLLPIGDDGRVVRPARHERLLRGGSDGARATRQPGR